MGKKVSTTAHGHGGEAEAVTIEDLEAAREAVIEALNLFDLMHALASQFYKVSPHFGRTQLREHFQKHALLLVVQRDAFNKACDRLSQATPAPVLAHVARSEFVELAGRDFDSYLEATREMLIDVAAFLPWPSEPRADAVALKESLDHFFACPTNKGIPASELLERLHRYLTGPDAELYEMALILADARGAGERFEGQHDSVRTLASKRWFNTLWKGVRRELDAGKASAKRNPDKGKRRGRPRSSNPEEDRRISRAWKNYDGYSAMGKKRKTYKDFAESQGMTVSEVRGAVNRDRMRENRRDG